MSYEDLALLFLLPPLLCAIVFYHELGHAVCARIAGMSVNSFGIGVASPFFVVGRRTRFYLAWRKPFQGITFFCSPNFFPNRWAMAFAMLGGVIGQTALSGLLLLGWAVNSEWTDAWLAAIAINTTITLANLLPFNIAVGKISLRSDGALIRATLRDGGSTSQSVTDTLRAYYGLRQLWQATGDLKSLHLWSILAAAAWIELREYDTPETS